LIKSGTLTKSSIGGGAWDHFNGKLNLHLLRIARVTPRAILL